MLMSITKPKVIWLHLQRHYSWSWKFLRGILRNFSSINEM